jgi:hypothetical protein
MIRSLMHDVMLWPPISQWETLSMQQRQSYGLQLSRVERRIGAGGCLGCDDPAEPGDLTCRRANCRRSEKGISGLWSDYLNSVRRTDHVARLGSR